MSNRKRGSSLVFVIAMMVLLGIFATGFLYMAEFTTQTTYDHVNELQQLYIAKSIHRAVTQAAMSGDLELLDAIMAETEDLPGEYTATTGDTELEMTDRTVVTVRIDLTMEVEEEGAEAYLDTSVLYADGKLYQFTAWLSCSEETEGVVGEVGTETDNEWVLRRQYQTDAGVP